MSDRRPVLVAGATGYVANRLVPALLERGLRVRALARSVEALRRRRWSGHPRLEIARGDLLDPPSLHRAAEGCGSVFYLVHTMIAQKEKFVEADRTAARHMAAAAEAAGIARIIYLGGLAGQAGGRALSRHLASRIEVARILQSGRVPATDLRAPMILGSGSASFEIMRYLVEHLPVMTTPRWVRSKNQPIAIRDVIAYLVGCLERPETAGETYDIGGPEVLTYQDLLAIYAEEAGLRRRVIIPVPVLTPTLSALWIDLVSPVPAAIAMPLTEGLTSDAVCGENRIRALIPRRLLGCREAIRIALERTAQALAEFDGGGDEASRPPEWPREGDAAYAGGTRFERGFELEVRGEPEALWRALFRIGGADGAFHLERLDRLRGLIDRAAGGCGRGRRSGAGAGLPAGRMLDCWRVARVEPPRRLLLVSAAKAPGEALLEFAVAGGEAGRARIAIRSRFFPRGLSGLLYWHALRPVHDRLFRGMLSAIARSAGAAPLGLPAPRRRAVDKQ
jgi:uncharacterized protein YbjT (DUF2867 family)